MKKHVRIFSLMMALLMVASLLCACFESSGTETTKVTTDKKKTSEGQDEKVEEITQLADVDDFLELTAEQQNAMVILNYVSLLSREIYQSKNSRVYLEKAYSMLINNTNPDAVDKQTQGQLNILLTTMNQYRMIAVKRERLEYLYEKKQAQQIRSLIPSPISVLNIVQSKDTLKNVVSVLYLAVDSATSYFSEKEANELQYLQDGWELDDQEAEAIDQNRRSTFNYMINIVREYNIDGKYALNEEQIEELVKAKNKTNLTSRIMFLENNMETYKYLPSYWIILADSYYDNGNYSKCLGAINMYEVLSQKILRVDTELTEVLPKVIVATKEVYSGDEYVNKADHYCELLLDNSNRSDWEAQYFIALTYIDLYQSTNDTQYLQNAYQLLKQNADYLADEQKEINDTYLSALAKVTIPDNATKELKNQIDDYNDHLEEERSKELPHISESLYLNCELLFAVMDQLDVGNSERTFVENLLHENDEELFLVQSIDNTVRFKDKDEPDIETLEFTYDKDELTIPAMLITDKCHVWVEVDNGSSKETYDDWTVEKVKRGKDQDDQIESFVATFKSKLAGSCAYDNGSTVTVYVQPVADSDIGAFNVSFTVESGLSVWKVSIGKKFVRIN